MKKIKLLILPEHLRETYKALEEITVKIGHRSDTLYPYPLDSLWSCIRIRISLKLLGWD